MSSNCFTDINRGDLVRVIKIIPGYSFGDEFKTLVGQVLEVTHVVREDEEGPGFRVCNEQTGAYGWFTREEIELVYAASY